VDTIGVLQRGEVTKTLCQRRTGRESRGPGQQREFGCGRMRDIAAIRLDGTSPHPSLHVAGLRQPLRSKGREQRRVDLRIRPPERDQGVVPQICDDSR
jgi:hypothetical protein